MDLGRSLVAHLTLRGVEQPSERTVELFKDSVGQVETFTGRDFDTLPYLFEGPISDHPDSVDIEEVVESPHEGSVYSALSHAVVIDSNLFGWDEVIDGPYSKAMVVEEVSHALQYDQADAWGVRSNLTSFFGESGIPEYSAEGFASYVGEQLTGFGGREDREQAIQGVYGEVPEGFMEEMLTDHLGLLFFEAHNDLYGFDETMDLAMTGMAETEMDYVHETIRESSIESELYKKAKTYGLYPD